MQPVISVILAVFNQEKYLEETIESVLRQTLQNFELLILDDGSTDNSANIIRRLSNGNNKIKVFIRENVGRCDAVNFLVEKSRGKWCALLDADDVMLPDRLEKQLAFHDSHPSVHASSCHCHYINATGKTLGVQKYPHLKSEEECREARSAAGYVQCAITGLFILREVYKASGGLRKEFWPCDDFEFTNRFIKEGYLLVINQQILMKYRIHSTSITAQRPLHTYDVIGYVMRCIDLRRLGLPDITFKEFMELRSAESIWKKMNRRRYNYSQIFFRNAGINIMSKNYLASSVYLLIASVLDPRHVVNKAICFFGK